MKIQEPDRHLLVAAGAAFGLSAGFAAEGLETEARTAAVFGLILPVIVKLVSLPFNKCIQRPKYKMLLNTLLLGLGITSIMLDTSEEVYTGLLTTSVVMTVAAGFKSFIRSSSFDRGWSEVWMSFAAGATALVSTLALYDGLKLQHAYRSVGALVGGLSVAGLNFAFLDKERVSLPCCVPRRNNSPITNQANNQGQFVKIEG